ncbi:hypothetical protein [Ciceribacter sp. L1K22]|uniref:hypothetical protein n=1 Tax=Ciceribacter sp. L1K22 TaxID=2820275 RepID=UPI001FEE656E|nr:hypothetical protein [Ciceribacter sp. L1K22]
MMLKIEAVAAPQSRPLDREDIQSHPLFAEIERQIALHLIAIHDRTPRLSRLKASHRKWLMTHSLFALSLQRRDDDPLSGLTATRFVDTVMRLAAASRNTATAYLAELVAYKFLRDVPDVPDRRVRVLETTEAAYDAMLSWFNGHLACLDRLDGGTRQQRSLADGRIFRLAQPMIAERLSEDPLWRDPPDSIGNFLWSDYGGMVLHDLITRIEHYDPKAETTEIAPLALSTLSDKYMLSTTNLKRMFKKSEDDGLIGWQQPRRRGHMWFSRSFLHDYFQWQSAKFAAVDAAFHEASSRLDDNRWTAAPGASG